MWLTAHSTHLEATLPYKGVSDLFQLNSGRAYCQYFKLNSANYEGTVAAPTTRIDSASPLARLHLQRPRTLRRVDYEMS